MKTPEKVYSFACHLVMLMWINLSPLSTSSFTNKFQTSYPCMRMSLKVNSKSGEPSRLNSLLRNQKERPPLDALENLCCTPGPLIT